MSPRSPHLRRASIVLGTLALGAGAWSAVPVSAAPSAATVQGRVVDLDPRTGVVAIAVGGAPPNVVLVRAGDARLSGAPSLDAVPDGWTISADTTSETVEGIEVRTASAVRVAAQAATTKPTTAPKPEDGGEH